jgi:hypothetical protein
MNRSYFREPIALIFSAIYFTAVTGCTPKKEPLPPFNPRPGSLEFCIVANELDDELAIEAARDYFESADAAELKRLAEAGSPPPPPKAKANQVFTFNGHDSRFRWVELDPSMINELGLSARNIAFSELGNELFEAQKTGEMTVTKIYDGSSRSALWSRACQNASLTAEQRASKQFDYFVLMRIAESGKDLTEAHLESINPGMDSRSNRIAINGKFNKEGSDRILALTEENRPDEGGRHFRHIAIIIQGKLFSMPALRSPIRDYFQITGDFTHEYVKEVVSRIRTAGQ